MKRARHEITPSNPVFEMDLYWGAPEAKKTVYEIDDDDLLYNIGSEIHYSEPVTKLSIEKLIKLTHKVIHQEKTHNASKKFQITYVIDTNGGSVSAVYKFVDFITMVKKKYPEITFASIITGTVASAGTIMSVIMDKRLMTRNASAMIHELQSGHRGMYSHLHEYMNYLKTTHDKIVQTYLNKCNKTKEELEELLIKESWFDAEKYLEDGFIDEII